MSWLRNYFAKIVCQDNCNFLQACFYEVVLQGIQTLIPFPRAGIWLQTQFSQRYRQIKDRDPNIFLNIFGSA